MREDRWCLAALVPIAVYEYVALKHRRVPTITEVVRTAPPWVKIPLAGAIAIAFSHLFFNRP